jgi:hypothetical protein
MMRVCHITENPIAGAPMNLATCLNKYQPMKVQCRHIAASDRNEARVYKSDLLTGVHTYDEIRKVLAEADILHFHNFYSKQELFRKYPDLWALCAKKPRCWQVHSQRSIKWMDIEEGLRDKRAKHLVIGQYHPREWPECTVVPNVIDIDDPLLRPQERLWTNPLRVAFSPSRIGLVGWDDKGYEPTKQTLQQLVNKWLITAEIIHNVPHEECLKRRGMANVVVDEIKTGSYHLVSLESLSQGCLVFAGLDEIQEKTLKDLTGAKWLPWARATANTLHQRLMVCIQDPSGVRLLANESRRWMQQWWHPKDMCQRFLDIYERM